MARWHRRAFFDNSSPMLDRFGAVLLLSATSVVGLALVDITGPVTRLTREAASLLAAVLVGGTLLVALRASGLARRRQRTLDVLVGLTVVGYALTVVLDIVVGIGSEQISGVSGAIAVLAVATPVVIVLRLLRHRVVTMATMYGAISAYLLIAVAYFFIFLADSQYQGTFFTDEQPSSSFMYFSLTTITTVGYGDLTAVTHLGRLFATSEAVIGQVYLVTFVAMIVGLRAQEWRSRSESLDPPPDASSPESSD